MFVTVGHSSRIPVNKISHLFSKRDSLVDSLWLSWRQPLICFLFSGEKIPTLTSHRERPFRNLDFRISQNNHISLCFRFWVLPHLSSTPRGELGTFWRRICTAPSAFRPPRLLCGRAASYGSVIVWKYQEAELFGFQGAALVSGKSIPKVFPFRE